MRDRDRFMLDWGPQECASVIFCLSALSTVGDFGCGDNELLFHAQTLHTCIPRNNLL